MTVLATKKGDFPHATNKAGGPREIHPNRHLIQKHNGRIFAFRDLPLEAQLAIAHYMGVDGEAWLCFEEFGVFEGIKWSEYPQSDDEHERNGKATVEGLTRCMNKIVDRYGDMEFGYVVVPTGELITLWSQIDSDAVKDFVDDDGKPNFDEYHKWYQGAGNTQAKSTWPVILGSFGDELLSDGWHRFHAYCANGTTEIACVWYPEKGKKIYDQ